MNHRVMTAHWPAPPNIKAYTTLQTCGNMAVPADRDLLKKELNLPEDPIWLQQTHSNIAIAATPENSEKEADASFTNQPNRVCVALTADCLPILVCNIKGTQVAAIHAGWKGLHKGIIEATINQMKAPPEELLIWLGPAISQKNYEVGDEVRQFFIDQNPQAKNAFISSPNQRWLADLYFLARLKLNNLGIDKIYGGTYCTYGDAELFYSARRESIKTGRMASLIYIEALSS